MSIYDKPSRDMLLDAINRQNGLTANPLTWQQIAAGFPEAVQTPGATRDTRVLLYGLNGQGYKGTVTITYDRISMPVLFRNLVPVVITNPVNKVSELLPFLNERYGLSLEPDDIEDFSVSDLGENWIADVKIKEGCLAWQGTFPLRYAKFMPNLNDVVTTVDLDAIVAPLTVAAKPHAEYVAYGYDWTELETAFTTGWAFNRVLTAADVDALNEVVPLKFTYAASPQQDEISLFGAVFKGTEAVTPQSLYRQEFRRVAKIQLATGSNYTGTLYLHYSPV